MLNTCIPLFKPGKDLPVHTSEAVKGKTFADISANIQSGPAISSVNLPSTYDGGNFVVGTCAVKKRAIGIFASDAASGANTAVLRGSGLVAPVIAGGAITAGKEVEVGAEGKAIELAAGVAVGKAYTTAASGEDCYVSLY
jgi:hypothetical protein